jgi:hypothetical protein
MPSCCGSLAAGLGAGAAVGGGSAFEHAADAGKSDEPCQDRRPCQRRERASHVMIAGALIARTPRPRTEERGYDSAMTKRCDPEG